MSRYRALLMTRELGVGGSERQLVEIARALDRDRFEVHVACLRSGGFREQELKAAGIPVVRLGADSFRSPAALAAASRMRTYLSRQSIDLVHTFDVPANLFGVPVARASGARSVLSSQRAHRDLTPGLRRRFLRLTDRLADGVVVNCLSVRQQLIDQDGVPPPKIHLCRNGLDTLAFRPGPRLRPPALEGASLVVGIVCALRPEKDLATLVEAFARVRSLRAGLKLAIIGSGPVEASLKQRCRELGLAGQCHFEPTTSRVADWLHGIDIFVLPSRSEALSNSLMEAMACGCCAIASNTGGTPELIQEGINGLLFRPGDAADLAGRLASAIENAALRSFLARQAASRIQEEFSLEASARAMAAIYQASLEGAGRAMRA
jgi:glycosyltransferase involved in cell wall biosynthesis